MEIEVGSLRCNGLVNPLSVGSVKPELSWCFEPLPGNAVRHHQTSFRCLCASSAEALEAETADLWDTGKMEGCDTRVAYRGQDLASFLRVFWKVMIWDGAGAPSGWSQTAEFTIGHLRPGDWRASWIGTGEALRHPAPFFRTSFESPGKPERAVLHATSLGVYEAYLNGARVGENVLAPEWTSYGKRLNYQSYDVTDLVASGENVLGAVIGDGWYAGKLGLSWYNPENEDYAIYGDRIALLAEIRLSYADGSSLVIGTGPDWLFTLDGPIIASDILDGELYDARRDLGAWDDRGFRAEGWSPAVGIEWTGASIVPQPNEPVRVGAEFGPVSISQPVHRIHVVDFGQNVAGWVRLRIRGAAKGRRVRLVHGERLTDDGRVYTTNLRAAAQADEYICRGDGEEIYEPRFTFHGFQFVEIHGLTHGLEPQDVTARAIWSAAVPAGRFECSNPMVNRIMEMILWTQRNNMVSVPTDCHQRDERLGWAGDILAYSRAACYNMDMRTFLRKWLDDLTDDQTDDGRFPSYAPHPNRPAYRDSGVPAWADAGILVPWELYVSYGDTEILERMYEPMCRWIARVTEDNPEHRWLNKRGEDGGDWLNADSFKIDAFPRGRAEIPKDVFATLFYYKSTGTLSRIAGIIGREDDAERYGKLAESIAKAFNDAYTESDGKIRGDTQSCYALALDFDILPRSIRRAAFGHLIRCLDEFDGHLSTGFLSTVPAMRQLVEFGQAERAYAILLKDSLPSWGYMLRCRATTVWERWDAWTEGAGYQTPEMNSFCHYAIGAVAEWIYAYVLGIRPKEDAPGYREFVISPVPGGGLTSAAGSYICLAGPIEVEWEHRSGEYLLFIKVPPNTVAYVKVRTDDSSAVSTEDEGLERQEDEPGFACFIAAPGAYRFTAPLSQGKPATD